MSKTIITITLVGKLSTKLTAEHWVYGLATANSTLVVASLFILNIAHPQIWMLILTGCEPEAPLGPHKVGIAPSFRSKSCENPASNCARFLKQSSVKCRTHSKMLGTVEGTLVKTKFNHWLLCCSTFGRAYKGDFPSQRKTQRLLDMATKLNNLSPAYSSCCVRACQVCCQDCVTRLRHLLHKGKGLEFQAFQAAEKIGFCGSELLPLVGFFVTLQTVYMNKKLYDTIKERGKHKRPSLHWGNLINKLSSDVIGCRHATLIPRQMLLQQQMDSWADPKATAFDRRFAGRLILLAKQKCISWSYRPGFGIAETLLDPEIIEQLSTDFKRYC